MTFKLTGVRVIAIILPLVFMSPTGLAADLECNTVADVQRFASGKTVKVIIDRDTFISAGLTDPLFSEQLEYVVRGVIHRINSSGANILLEYSNLSPLSLRGQVYINVSGSSQTDGSVQARVSYSHLGSLVVVYKANSSGNIRWGFGNLSSILLHEFGHALGLGHESEVSIVNSIMQCTGNNSHNFLGSDDIDDLKSLYGKRRFALDVWRSADSGVNWTTVNSNISRFPNVFSSSPISVVSKGNKTKYRKRMAFFTNHNNNPAYIVSEQNSDGTVSENFSSEGIIFDSYSLLGTGADTDGAGEHLVAWLESTDAPSVKLRIMHNNQQLAFDKWVDVSPSRGNIFPQSTPSVAYLGADSWLVAYFNAHGSIFYLLTHNDGDSWITTGSPHFAGKHLIQDGVLLKSGGKLSITVNPDSEEILFSYPSDYDDPLSDAVYQHVITIAELDGDELVVKDRFLDEAVWSVGGINVQATNQNLVRIHNNSASMFEAAFTGGFQDFGWQFAGAPGNSTLDTALSVNTGLTINDCRSSDISCRTEASRAGAAYVYAQRDMGGYAENIPDLEYVTYDKVATISPRDERASLANADHEVFLRPRIEWPNGGVCADIIVTNNAGETVRPWKIVLEGIRGQVYDFWNADWEQHGSTVVVTPRADVNWPGCCNLSPGEETNIYDFGFCSGSDAGVIDPLPVPEDSVVINIYDRFNGGYCGLVTVFNNGTSGIVWEATFNILGELRNSWNLNVLQDYGEDASGWRTLRVKGAGWNDNLEPGELTHDIGFCVDNRRTRNTQPE